MLTNRAKAHNRPETSQYFFRQMVAFLKIDRDSEVSDTEYYPSKYVYGSRLGPQLQPSIPASTTPSSIH